MAFGCNTTAALFVVYTAICQPTLSWSNWAGALSKFSAYICKNRYGSKPSPNRADTIQ